MRIDLSDGPQTHDYTSVPAGTYVCQVADVRAGTTRAGDPRWGLRLVVAEGEFVGRHAAWDGLVFSARGRTRVRLVLAALGLPNTGTIDLEVGQLIGRRALVQVRPSEFENPAGDVIRRNEVPYDGYRPLPEEASPEGASTGSEESAVSSDAVSQAGSRDPGQRGGDEDVDPNEIPF